MNNARRKVLRELQNTIESKLVDLATNLPVDLAAYEEAKDDIAVLIQSVEEVRDAEQEAFDNLSENLQGSAKGEDMQYAITSMETALTSLEEARERVEAVITALEAMEDLQNLSETIVGELNNAEYAGQ